MSGKGVEMPGAAHPGPAPHVSSIGPFLSVSCMINQSQHVNRFCFFFLFVF